MEDIDIVGVTEGLKEGKLLFPSLGIEEGSSVADFEGSIDGLFDEGAKVTRNEGLVLCKVERANDGEVVGNTLGIEVRTTLGFPDRILVG